MDTWYDLDPKLKAAQKRLEDMNGEHAAWVAWDRASPAPYATPGYDSELMRRISQKSDWDRTIKAAEQAVADAREDVRQALHDRLANLIGSQESSDWLAALLSLHVLSDEHTRTIVTETASTLAREADGVTAEGKAIVDFALLSSVAVSAARILDILDLPMKRIVFKLRANNGLDWETIAGFLGISKSAAHQRYSGYIKERIAKVALSADEE